MLHENHVLRKWSHEVLRQNNYVTQHARQYEVAIINYMRAMQGKKLMHSSCVQHFQYELPGGKETLEGVMLTTGSLDNQT